MRQQVTPGVELKAAPLATGEPLKRDRTCHPDASWVTFGYMTPYEPRPVVFLGLWSVDGWQLKVYGIAHGRPQPREELVAAARHAAKERLRLLPTRLRHHGVGFLGIHDGRTSNFVFLDFWAEENELHHHVYTSPNDDPGALTYATPTGLSACVWDLKLQAFERDAWVIHVLRSDGDADVPAYLATTLNAEV